ncbi:MAG: thiamine pyrophosphate-binding protein [Proteobacteria bacterium]|nr:thiamine pyrophosphate-binding protein [Pseudomonadota bacterium]
MGRSKTGDNVTRRLGGGEVLAEMLRAHGAGPMFGMGGFQLLPFYEAIRALGLEHNLINDERAGIFAADAYARVTGRPGICDATLGPGATNLVSGLAESLNAGIPLVVLVGDTHRGHSWKNMTQECRQLEALRPLAKEVIRIEIGTRIPEHVRRAFALATSGRPGPVVLDVPEDVCHGTFEFAADALWADPETLSVPARRTRPAGDDLVRTARLLAEARKPVLLVGGGLHLSGAYEALGAAAENLAIPVAHTMSGKGALACVHPLSVGLFGRYSRIANDLIAESDCLFAVGCKLGEIATRRFQIIPEGVPLIHLDVLAEEIGRHQRVAVALWADARAGLEDLVGELRPKARALRERRAPYLADIARRKAAWRADAEARLTSAERPIGMARLCHELTKALPDEAVLVADGGFAGHWTSLLYDTKRAGRTYIANRGMASIGYGLPGAIGARAAARERPVVAICGDGGLNMSLGDLETALRMRLGFALVVVNNAASGYVKALQHGLYGGRYQSSDLVEMDYARIAESFGCRGIRVTDPDRLGEALRAGMAESCRPGVIDVVVTRDPGRMLPAIDARTRA